MIQPADFRYTLTVNSVPYILLNAVEGWEETFLNFKRSGNYFGLVRSFTVPMKFVLDGAYLIRLAVYGDQGINAKIQFKIEELNRSNWVYRSLYDGEIDLIEFQDTGSSSGNIVTVRCTDVGIAEMIAIYDKAEYEIPLTEDNSVLVEVPGISLIDIAQNLILPQSYDFLPNGIRKILPNDVEINELINARVETRISVEENNPNFATSSNWIVKANFNTEVVISGVFEGTIQYRRSDARVVIELINNLGVVRETLINYNQQMVVESFEDPSSLVPRSVFIKRIPFSVTVSLSDGERLFLTIRKTIESAGTFKVRYMPVRISNEILTQPSTSRSIKANELFLELIRKMNNGNDEGARSDLLTSSNLFLTCGDAIREFDSPVIKTSFQDFYKSMDAVLGVGFGIDSLPRLEIKEFFYRELPCLDLGDIKEFQLSIDNDFMFSAIKAGYRKQKYEEDQGREEFNQGQSWTSSNSKTDRVLDIVSQYRADQHGIAVLRRLTIIDNLKGIDSESDNDVWILQGSGVEEEGIHKLEKGSDLDYVTGIANPENAINVRLSPKRNMLRNGSLLRSGLKGFESTVLSFGSADRNADLVSQIDGRIVSERQDQSVSAMNKALILPYKVKIKTALPLNAWKIITENMYGYFTFRHNSSVFKGFIKEASTDVAKDSDREITLNLHRDTDLTKLIL